MTCSVIIPSRARVQRLFATIFTLLNAGNPDNFEILLRLDDDDADTLKYSRTMKGLGRVRIVTGPRTGWESHAEMCDGLVRIAEGKWLWPLTDDCLIGGKEFDTKLRQVPLKGFIVQPEVSLIGGSTYHRWEGSNFPIFPKNCWQQYGWPKLCHPIDIGIDQLLRVQNGWRTQFLPGITAWHLQDDADKLAEHRK